MSDVSVIDLYKRNIIVVYNSNGSFNWPINSIRFLLNKQRKEKKERSICTAMMNINTSINS
jgi:hypothetical protein